MEVKSFRARFCEFYGVPDEHYERRMIQLCLHPPWGLISKIIGLVLPGWFAIDLQIVRQLGLANNRTNLSAEIRDIRADYIRNHDFGFTRRYWRRRLSAERLFFVTRQIWKD